jgi:tetrahydromethanopterin S-methyltransferase subunit B
MVNKREEFLVQLAEVNRQLEQLEELREDIHHRLDELDGE